MTYTIELPEALKLSEEEVRIILAGELYERGLLSLGQAAKVADLAKRNFIEIMGKYGFSIFQQSEEELLEEIKNA